MDFLAESSEFVPKPQCALLIVAHGATGSPDSSDPAFEQAQAIRDRKVFAEVHCAFWKEEPDFRAVRYSIESEVVYVVPNFVSEGYFTREVIPREMELAGPSTRIHGKTWRYCDPVGVHPNMGRLLLWRARETAPDADPAHTALLIAGHGTSRNAQSAEAVRSQVRSLRKKGAPYREIVDAYMEESPRIADWEQRCSSPSVIVVPFFIADGVHSYRDIPELLGIEPVPRSRSGQPGFPRAPVQVRGRTLYYGRAIGSEPVLSEIILDQVREFDLKYRNTPPSE